MSRFYLGLSFTLLSREKGPFRINLLVQCLMEALALAAFSLFFGQNHDTLNLGVLMIKVSHVELRFRRFLTEASLEVAKSSSYVSSSLRPDILRSITR